MSLLRWMLACLVVSAVLGCEGLPEEKPLDQGKADRAMEQVEKGNE